MSDNILPLMVWIPLTVFYTVGFTGLLDPSFEKTAMALINSGNHWTPQESESLLIERLEALLWLTGFIGFLIGRYRETNRFRGRWLIGFCLLCFLALGEETSWGQHYLHYVAPEAVKGVNVQNEFNVHNTNLSALLGVPSNHFLYPSLENLTHYLNPAFYIFCMFLWGGLPLFSPFALQESRILRAYPRYHGGCYLLLWLFFSLYLITDNRFFDAGELLELTFAAAGSCLGIYSAQQLRSGP